MVLFEVIAYGIVLVFALLGVIASIYMLAARLHRAKAEGRFVVVIPCSVGPGELASLLCAARMRIGLFGDITHNEVIALDCGLPEHIRRQCEALCREMDRIRLCRPEELMEILREDE